MDVINQSFMILGASKSGVATAEYLLNSGNEKVFVYEQISNDVTKTNLDRLSQKNAVILTDKQAEETLNIIDVLVVSPGVPINHPLCVKAKQLGKRIIGELEFGYNAFVPPIIAVTGTNGKTTTVSLIKEIFDRAKRGSHLLGNIGVPLTEKLSNINREDACIVEVSSFQLETTNAFCPHVSCILNLSPDHLDRHYTMENYLFLKKKIFKNQKESEYAVLNYDDQTIRTFYSEIKAKVVWVSLKEKVDGAYLLDGKLYYKNEFIIDQNDLSLQGKHNEYNALFSIACARLLGVSVDYIKQGLSQFKGIKNRLELIGEYKGVKYVNDSKATNTSSTINAINSLKNPTVLILGGSEKGESYTKLFEKVKDSLVKHVVITGASRFKMIDEANKVGIKDMTVTSDFDVAVKVAKMIANSGDTVLLSPACASFDCFTSYDERGERFRKIVEKISEEINIT